MTDLPLTLDELPVMLDYIPSDKRDLWISVGMGLKAEFGDSAYDAFRVWSSGYKEFKEKTCAATWKSFRGSGVTIATVIRYALDNGWKREQQEISLEDRARLEKEAEARRALAKQQSDEEGRLEAVMHGQVSRACFQLFSHHCTKQGTSAYLATKQVKAHGCGFLKHGLVLVMDSKQETAEIITGSSINEFFKRERPGHVSFIYMQKGELVIPLVDFKTFWAVQYISGKGTKKFPKYSKKSGSFHVLGELTAQSSPEVILLAEGYATGASVYEALVGQYPVVVCFDSGNLPTVAEYLKGFFPNALFICAADDDVDNDNNAGRHAAEKMTRVTGGVAFFPDFSEVVR